MWTKKQIADHIEAGALLERIKNDVYSLIQQNKRIPEKEVITFIKKAYKKYGLINDNKKESCIAAFGKNTSHVHYFPSSSSNFKLKTGNLILLDMWARLNKNNAPYADITWMFYVGKKIPNDIQSKWNVLIKSRDTAIKFIQKNKFPRGVDIDRVAHDYLGESGFGKNILHTIGHSLGLKHPHGEIPGINWREYSRIQKNIGYTIEPGIYFKGKYGFRTEIDFYVNDENKVIITTPLQSKLDLIN